MNKAIVVGGLGIVAALITVFLIRGDKPESYPTPTTATSTYTTPTPSYPTPQSTYATPQGLVVKGIGVTQTIDGVKITPLEVTEDSRCPQGVQCIWAGTVKVKTNIAKASGNSTQVLELGKAYSNGTEDITLASIAPYPKSGETIAKIDYRFEFTVKATKPVVSGCYVGGCSGQLCTDQKDGLASTCEWTEAYACYRTAKCERQATGKCGWTQTAELQMCLTNAK